MHLYEKTVGSRDIYSGRVFRVREDKALLENGETVSRELILHGGGVCVVPVNEKGEVLMVRQFRYPFGQPLLEVPAGKLEAGEGRAECGRRELLEEVGAEASEYEYMGVMYPSPAYLNEQIHIYLAGGLTYSEQRLDDDEFLDVVKLPLSEAVEMVMRNEIFDAKTKLALLMADKKLSGR